MNMHMRGWPALLAVGLSLLHPSTAPAERPDILFIITDDQEPREFNFLPEGRDEQGKPRNLSPNIDRLATEGLVLLNQYVSSPVCTPSRYAVLTGTYASRSPTFAKAVQNDEQINITWNSHIDRETPNIARTLKKAGKPFFLYMVTTLNHGPGPRNKKHTSDPLATPAGFLETPLSVRPPRSSIPEPVRRAGLPVEGQTCDVLLLDDGVGAILNKIETLGALENTIISYFDDHGVEDGKGSLHQGGIKSVSFVWPPRKAQ